MPDEKPLPKTGEASPKKPEGETIGGATTTAHKANEEPCCCHIVLVVEKITVKTRTDAGFLPIGITSDHVLLQTKDCSGKKDNWPENGTPANLSNGDSADPNLIIATIMPTGNDCAVKCDAVVKAIQVPLVNSIIDQIEAILLDIASLHEEAAKAAAKLKAASDKLGVLKKIIPAPATAIADALTEIASDKALLDSIQAKIDALMKSIAKLLEILFNTNDMMMIEEHFIVDGYEPCNSDNWINAIVAPKGWVMAAGDANRATLKIESTRHGGDWVLDISATRVCPPGH